MSNYLVIFHGVDATSAPTPVPDALTAVKTGHRIVNVINLNTYVDATNGFVPLVLTDSEIVQNNGQDWSSYSFVALMERP
jgi:hypothetical protein